MYDRRLAIESVTRLGLGQFVLEFESPEIAAECRPGQFIMVTVADTIDPLLRRPMAVYRVLRGDDGEPRGFSMVVEVAGRGTALLEQKEAGDFLRVLGPLGVPFSMPETSSDSGAASPAEAGEQLLVMGGVGSAPFPFLAEHLRAQGFRVRAFVGARTAEALLCVDDFDEMDIPAEVSTDDGTQGYHGFVVGPLEEYLDREAGEGTRLYACGPTPMMRAVHEIALARDLPLQVSFEAPMACGIGVCLSCVLRLRDDATETAPVGSGTDDSGWHYARCCREGPVFESRKLVWE